MEIRVASETLVKELALFEGIVDRKATLPVLQNVKVVANGGVSMSATCIDVSLDGPCSGAVDKPGQATIPASRLLEMAKALAGSEVRIRVDDAGAVRVTAGRYASRLQALPVDTFPELRVPDGGFAPVPIERAALARLIRQVRFAFSSGDQRYFLDGCELSFDGCDVRLVATDSHRLAVATHRAATPYPELPPVVIPSRAALALVDALDVGGTDPVQFGEQDGTLFFRVDGRLLSSRTVDGKFPAWQRIVTPARAYTLEARADRVALKRAVQRVGLVATGVRIMKLTMDANTVSIAAESAEVGDAVEVVEATYAGPPTTIAVKSEYLLDALTEAVGAQVALSFKDARSALAIVDGSDYYCIVMPVSL